jgi:Sec7-like guanine-nucleotide exchange factor
MRMFVHLYLPEEGVGMIKRFLIMLRINSMNFSFSSDINFFTLNNIGAVQTKKIHTLWFLQVVSIEDRRKSVERDCTKRILCNRKDR